MADFNIYWPIENKLEGVVFENVPGDEPTKFGLVMNDIKEFGLGYDVQTLKDLQPQQAMQILKKLYWDFFKADDIKNQNLAMFIVDAGLLNGPVLIADAVQEIVGFKGHDIDGMFGSKTITAINLMYPFELYCKLYGYRLRRFDDLKKINPAKTEQDYAGWINRLNAIKVAY